MSFRDALARPIVVPTIERFARMTNSVEGETYITPGWLLKWGVPLISVFLLAQWMLIQATVKATIGDAVTAALNQVDTKYVSRVENDARRAALDDALRRLADADSRLTTSSIENASRIRQLEIEVERLKTANGKR